MHYIVNLTNTPHTQDSAMTITLPINATKRVPGGDLSVAQLHIEWTAVWSLGLEGFSFFCPFLLNITCPKSLVLKFV